MSIKTYATKRVLITGLSGTGKSYVSAYLQTYGINAFDADEIKGLPGWFDKMGNKVTYPENPDQNWLNTHDWLWNIDFLNNWLLSFPEVKLFGISSNWIDCVNSFDRVFCLTLDKASLLKRLNSEYRANPFEKTIEQQEIVIKNSRDFAKYAQSNGAILLDAALSPDQINFEIDMSFNPVSWELIEMRKKDQEQFNGDHFDEEIIRKHTAILKDIFRKYGCITISKFGRLASHSAWLIVQHSNEDINFQELYLSEMEKNLDDVLKRDYAYLYDRVMVNKGQPQLYGTQFDPSTRNKSYSPFPIQDIENLNQRRSSMGLEDFGEYLEYMKGKWG